MATRYYVVAGSDGGQLVADDGGDRAVMVGNSLVGFDEAALASTSLGVDMDVELTVSLNGQPVVVFTL